VKVLVCGGRDFNERQPLWDALYRLNPCTIIEGGARGADKLGAEWARHTGTPLQTFPARWLEEGRAAGVLRNQRMLDEGRPDLVLVCPGGRGTADMTRRAREAGLPIQHLIRVTPAQGIEAGTDETPTAAQPGGREPGPKDAPSTPPTPPHPNRRCL
jgi:hypothetical protein